MTLINNLQLAKLSASYPIVETGSGLFTFTDSVNQLIGHVGQTSERVDRVQIQPGPGLYQFLVRHSDQGHFCGYVVIDQKKWDSIPIEGQRVIRDRAKRWVAPVSFCGENNAIITWCTQTTRGKLSIPVRLNPVGPDLILGFSTQGWKHDSILPDNYYCTGALHEFASVIREGIDEYSTVRR